jgi:hypothetical protein
MRSPLGEAAIAYRDLATCYRIGKPPSEKLWKALDDATVPLAEYLAQRDKPDPAPAHATTEALRVTYSLTKAALCLDPAPAQDAKVAGTATADGEASYPIKLSKTSKGPFEAEIVQPAPKEAKLLCKGCTRTVTAESVRKHHGILYHTDVDGADWCGPVVVELPEGGGGRKA